LHGGTIDDPIDETIEAFEILVRRARSGIMAFHLSDPMLSGIYKTSILLA
jgi:hypothetical protein